jgi:two-component system, NtrC family, response regulator GlrR
MASPGREATRLISKQGRAVACAIRAYRLSIKHADGSEETREIAQSTLRAGAQPGHDLVLADDAVSRIHFEIVAEPLGFRLRDLGSTNGTFVDGYRAIDLYLKSGARIRAGRSHLQFETLDTEAQLALDAQESFGPLIGASAAMRALFGTLRKVAASNTTVLVEGESGTGKELIAEAIHGASPRAEQPFVVFDCSSVPANLMESELFGHEKGAFTGAESRRIGRIAEADGGTLFLDEIGELPGDLQPKLLRFVEAREFRPLGGDRALRADVRIIAATNRDLATEVNRATFRHDLYYRLAVVRISVPPLRARTEDIPRLVEHFLRRACSDRPSLADEILASITPEIWQRLEAQPWRGNVRELRNAVERAIALGPSELAGDTDAGLGRAAAEIVQRAEPATAARPVAKLAPFQDAKRDVLARFEREYFAELWAQCSGNVSEVARRAGMERANVRAYLRRHAIGQDDG